KAGAGSCCSSAPLPHAEAISASTVT
ncbi:uncharacterized protein METZ01_LOCUS123281, partial [marine metagenome]